MIERIYFQKEELSEYPLTYQGIHIRINETSEDLTLTNSYVAVK